MYKSAPSFVNNGYTSDILVDQLMGTSGPKTGNKTRHYRKIPYIIPDVLANFPAILKRHLWAEKRKKKL